MSALEVALGSSAEYLPHAATAIHSVLAQRGGLHVRVHYLHGPEVTTEDRRRLESMVAAGGGELVLHELAEDRIEGLPAAGHIPPTMWYRSFLPELLPDVDRVLYLDADTLAVDALAPLWETALDGHYLAAVTNVWEPWNAAYPQKLGLEDPGSYFNSGVLLMNLELIRSDGAIDRVFELARSGRRLLWGDQDALNVVLGHRRLALHPRWNCMNSVLEFPQAVDVFGEQAVDEARRSPGIRHFEGPSINKPWHVRCAWPLREEYLRHRRQTPWPEIEFDDSELPSARRRLRDRVRARLRRAVPETPLPPDPFRASLDPADRAIVDRCRPLTLTSPERIVSLIDAVRHVERAAVPGAFAECGVWRGGSVLAMILTLQDLGVEERDIHLYDTFEGMTQPGPEDVSPFDAPGTFPDYFDERTQEKTVRSALLATGYPPERLHFVRGTVEETLPAHAPEQLALLRLDTDWYASTRHELVHLYPRLASGGVLIVDDYGHWAGARRAVDEYFAAEAPPILLARVDYTARVGVKR